MKPLPCNRLALFTEILWTKCLNFSDLFQILVLKVRPLEVDREDGLVVVDQRRDDGDDSLDVVLFRHGRGALRPEQRRPEDDGDVEGRHLCRLAVFGKLVQKLKRPMEKLATLVTLSDRLISR